LAENLDSSIEEFLSVIIQNYVLSWYRWNWLFLVLHLFKWMKYMLIMLFFQ
jgi:hypothetical protein